MKKLRCGVIGLGRVGKMHVENMYFLNSTCVFISFKNHYFTKNLDCFSHIVTLFTTTFQSFLINH